MSYFIGIDIGTGSTKAIAIDDQASQILESEQVSYPTIQPAPHQVEQDPEVIWNAFVTCLTSITHKFQTPPAAVSFSSAMHSVIPVDRQCQPLMNMITWADGRSAHIAEETKSSPEARDIYENTGAPIHAMTPFCKIIWLHKHNPEIFNKTHKFISIKEYIWYKLFGVFEVDDSIASGTGLFDIVKASWYEPALKAAGISSGQLSTPVSIFHHQKDVQHEALRSHVKLKGTAFIIGSSDGCLANLGSNALSPGTASLTIGTSGAIRIASDKPCYNFKSMTFNYRLDGKLFICGGPVNNGGAAMKWCLHDLLEKEEEKKSYEDTLKKTENIPAGAEGLIFLPYLMGDRAPIWNSMASGVFFGITMRHKQTHFVKAVMEGILYALYGVGRALEEASGSITKINASGGFVHSDEWLQILADIFNKKICRQNVEDASAIGAALIAIRTLHELDEYPAFKDAGEPKMFIPRQEQHKRYAELYALYERLYEKLKDEMRLVYHMNDH